MIGRRGARTSRRRRSDDHRVVHQVASWCLTYPGDDLLARLPMISAALAEQPDSEPVTALQRFVEHLDAADPHALRGEYVDVFDLSKQQTLYLSYWSDGDTRRRGEVLAGFKQVYRDSGFLVNLRGELPDYLPVVLEYAARADAQRGRELLIEHRASLELIRLSLAEKSPRYADVMTAVCATLPGASPADRASAMAMRASPPQVETVGLEPYDARLLPLSVEPRRSTAS